MCVCVSDDYSLTEMMMSRSRPRGVLAFIANVRGGMSQKNKEFAAIMQKVQEAC